MVTVNKGALTRDRFAWYWSCQSKSGDPLGLPVVTVVMGVGFWFCSGIRLGFGHGGGFNLL